MNGSIVHEGCMGTTAIREAHTHPASSGLTLRASKWAMDTIEAPASGKARFKVSNIPPSVKDVRTIVRTALAQARAEGVRA
ncbi:hypothetical protein [Thermococcus aciditolerans]|uniref:Uncharacterized protein n=1 Tax=Thermococcus aciditolerans TaxID=2598455 RepID=A0A5C0SMC5_9EURY|nr:hypothetical protein [Thermococcus aciditolerans]QEK15152.1 hypothetical protein FPV09_08635 [Thermococcus aciditolerans]